MSSTFWHWWYHLWPIAAVCKIVIILLTKHVAKIIYIQGKTWKYMDWTKKCKIRNTATDVITLCYDDLRIIAFCKIIISCRKTKLDFWHSEFLSICKNVCTNGEPKTVNGRLFINEYKWVERFEYIFENNTFLILTTNSHSIYITETNTYFSFQSFRLSICFCKAILLIKNN